MSQNADICLRSYVIKSIGGLFAHTLSKLVYYYCLTK